MTLNILDIKEIEKIEKRLSEKYKKPIEINIKTEKDTWYYLEKLILELKYRTIEETEIIANSPRIINSLKKLNEMLFLLLKCAKEKYPDLAREPIK